MYRQSTLGGVAGLLLCLATSLSAQQTTALTPWTIGAELSSALYIDAGPGSSRGADEAATYQIAGLKVGYRPLRWLELWGRYRYHVMTAQLEVGFAPPTDEARGGLASRHYQLNVSEYLVGAEGLFRVGPGDLGLSLGIGTSRRSGRLKAVSNDGDVYLADVFPINGEGRIFAQLAYTYWPIERFGVRLALSHSGLSRRVNNIVSVRLDENLSEGGVFDNPQMQATLPPVYRAYTATYQLGAGVEFRF